MRGCESCGKDSIRQCHLQKADLLEYEKLFVSQLRPELPLAPPNASWDLRCACWKSRETVVQRERSLDMISRGVAQVLNK